MVINSNLCFFRRALVGLAFAVAFAVSTQAQPKTTASPTATVTPAKSDDELLTESPEPAASPGAANSDQDLLNEETPAAKSDDEILDPLQLPILVPNGPIEPPPEELSPLKKQLPNPVDPHADLFAKSHYPSASECAACHEQIYDEWRSSNHAYASISPVFHKFEQKLTNLAQGTPGYFCMRCHGGVGTSMSETREEPLWKRAAVSREGVTCITCHRVNEEYTKVNGERRIVP